MIRFTELSSRNQCLTANKKPSMFSPLKSAILSSFGKHTEKKYPAQNASGSAGVSVMEPEDDNVSIVSLGEEDTEPVSTSTSTTTTPNNSTNRMCDSLSSPTILTMSESNEERILPLKHSTTTSKLHKVLQKKPSKTEQKSKSASQPLPQDTDTKLADLYKRIAEVEQTRIAKNRQISQLGKDGVRSKLDKKSLLKSIQSSDKQLNKLRSEVAVIERAQSSNKISQYKVVETSTSKPIPIMVDYRTAIRINVKPATGSAVLPYSYYENYERLCSLSQVPSPSITD